MFRKLQQKKRSVHVVEEVLHAISTGSLKVGDKLPSEQEIAELTGVSRPSVREALGVLRFVGVLDTKVGNGTYVKFTSQGSGDGFSIESDILSILDQGENPFEALEARRVLETRLVKYAVERHTPRDLARMKDALNRIVVSSKENDYDSLLLADREFHEALGRATGNSLLEQMLHSLLEVMEKGLWPRLKIQWLTTEKDHLSETRRTHRELFEAFESRDVDKAVACMERHFDEIDRLFQVS